MSWISLGVTAASLIASQASQHMKKGAGKTALGTAGQVGMAAAPLAGNLGAGTSFSMPEGDQGFAQAPFLPGHSQTSANQAAAAVPNPMGEQTIGDAKQASQSPLDWDWGSMAEKSQKFTKLAKTVQDFSRTMKGEPDPNARISDLAPQVSQSPTVPTAEELERLKATRGY